MRVTVNHLLFSVFTGNKFPTDAILALVEPEQFLIDQRLGALKKKRNITLRDDF